MGKTHTLNISFNHFAKEMKIMKKILLALVVLAFLATPAVAGNQPEFDAVGCDATNYFNDFIRVKVCETAERNGVIINEFSDFTNILYGAVKAESFTQLAGYPWPDTCFDGLKRVWIGDSVNEKVPCAYESSMTDTYNEGSYTWSIVLQLKPESDIDLNIRDCVVKHNTFNVWGECEQTGRYRAYWGELFFVAGANPLVTVTAFPGPYATPGFPADGMLLWAREMPGLELVALDGVPYTSKCLWEEALVIKLPKTLEPAAGGGTEVNLKQGDRIVVEIAIPGTNSVDLSYGQDNVSLKYIGITGTEYIGDACGECGDCENPILPQAS